MPISLRELQKMQEEQDAEERDLSLYSRRLKSPYRKNDTQQMHPEAAKPEPQGVLKFARFLYEK